MQGRNTHTHTECNKQSSSSTVTRARAQLRDLALSPRRRPNPTLANLRGQRRRPCDLGQDTWLGWALWQCQPVSQCQVFFLSLCQRCGQAETDTETHLIYAPVCFAYAAATRRLTIEIGDVDTDEGRGTRDTESWTWTWTRSRH